MAITKRVVISVHRKISDDNYGSFGVDVTEEVELEEDDVRKEVGAIVRARAIKSCEAALNEVMAALPAKRARTK